MERHNIKYLLRVISPSSGPEPQACPSRLPILDFLPGGESPLWPAVPGYQELSRCTGMTWFDLAYNRRHTALL